MNKYFFLFAGLTVFLFSCSKSSDNACNYNNSNVVVPVAETVYLQNYITANSIPARDSLGIFYEITNAGTGATATLCSNITVTYTGSLLSTGSVFDSSPAAGVSFVLRQLIVGWQRGLPLIKSGGSMTIYIPPSLGYGASDRTDGNGNVVIPANSYLKFTIQLLDVQ